MLRALISRIAIIWFGRSVDVRTAQEVDIDRASAEVLNAWEFYLKGVLPPEIIQTAPLDRLIESFLNEMHAILPQRFPTLRSASVQQLDLISFRGILFSFTHPREQMVAAVRVVSDRLGY